MSCLIWEDLLYFVTPCVLLSCYTLYCLFVPCLFVYIPVLNAVNGERYVRRCSCWRGGWALRCSGVFGCCSMVVQSSGPGYLV